MLGLILVKILTIAGSIDRSISYLTIKIIWLVHFQVMQPCINLSFVRSKSISFYGMFRCFVTKNAQLLYTCYSVYKRFILFI